MKHTKLDEFRSPTHRSVHPFLVVVLLALVAAPASAGGFYQVDSTSDLVDQNVGDGICASSALPNSCTLRAAVQESNASGGGSIQIPAGTYALTIAGIDEDAGAAGDLDLITPVVISGPSADPADVTISAAGLSDRVFHVLGTGTFRFQGMTIRDGSVTSSCGAGGLCTGGGILNLQGRVEVIDSTVIDNLAPFSAGISNQPDGELYLERSSVVGNIAVTNSGGIGSRGPLTLIDSTVSRNQAEAGDAGIGFSSSPGPHTILRSTLSDNVIPESASYSDGNGAAIRAVSAEILMVNSTVSGNETVGSGGGLWISNSTVTLRNVTITDNHGDADGDSTGESGGLFLVGTNDVTLENTVLSANREGTTSRSCQPGDEADGLQSLGHNVIGACSLTLTTGDIGDDDPQVAPLADNGGFGETHLPLEGSLVIDAGDPAGCVGLTPGSVLDEDQTGFARPQDGDGDGDSFCDIGAVEAEAVPEPGARIAAGASLLALAGLARRRRRGSD